eukprot:3745283-Pyramimonas_sp.AAC.1
MCWPTTFSREKHSWASGAPTWQASGNLEAQYLRRLRISSGKGPGVDVRTQARSFSSEARARRRWRRTGFGITHD